MLNHDTNPFGFFDFLYFVFCFSLVGILAYRINYMLDLHEIIAAGE